MDVTTRRQRSYLAVPGSNPRMLAGARLLPADTVFLDLEDSVPATLKPAARVHVIDALRTHGWRATTMAVRINDLETGWAHRDVADVVGLAGAALDVVLLPKAESAAQVRFLDLLITSVERAVALPAGKVGIDVQIESPAGVIAVNEIAGASARLRSIVLGTGDLVASTGMRAQTIGELVPDYPADPYHHLMFRVLVAARANDLAAIDGPYSRIRDVARFRVAADRAAALGFDGKLVLHPAQIGPANEAFGD